MMADFTLQANVEPPRVVISARIGLPPAQNDELLRDTTILRAQVGAVLTSLGDVLDSMLPLSETVNAHYEEWVEYTGAIGDEVEPEEEP
jgi:hypothetical protein